MSFIMQQIWRSSPELVHRYAYLYRCRYVSFMYANLRLVGLCVLVLVRVLRMLRVIAVEHCGSTSIDHRLFGVQWLYGTQRLGVYIYELYITDTQRQSET